MSVLALDRRADQAPGLDLDAILPALTARFAATAEAHDRDASFPFDNFTTLHEAGLLTLTTPREYGGQGADLTQALKMTQAVARGEPSTALVLIMQFLFHAALAGRAGWPEHLKVLVADDARLNGGLINALRVEPDLGTPARGGLPSTVARRTPQGWRLDGRKIYCTGSPALTWMVVWARTDEDTPRVGGWLVHRDTPGWRIEETWDHTGLRASGSHDVVFENLLVPEDRALSPQPLSAPSPPDPMLAIWSPVLTASIYDAVARAGRDWFIGWALDRKARQSGGAPLHLAALPGDRRDHGRPPAAEPRPAGHRRRRGSEAVGGRTAQAPGDRERHFGGGEGDRGLGKSGSVAPQRLAAALPRRALRPHPHAAGGHDPDRSRQGGIRCRQCGTGLSSAMGRLVVASQLSAEFNATLASHAGDVDILALPPGPPATLPREAAILVAAPFRRAGGQLPANPPPQWPFDLRWIQLVSVGIDFYPPWLFDGLAVTSARGSSAVALAEFALAAIFALAKRLPQIWIDSAEAWSPSPLTIVQGQTLGLVGFGAIGEALAPRALGLGMNVLAVRRSDRPIAVPGVTRVCDIATLFECSDHVVLAAPATSETEGMINRAVLAHAKAGLHLINIARGALIDDAALLAALDDGAAFRWRAWT